MNSRINYKNLIEQTIIFYSSYFNNQERIATYKIINNLDNKVHILTLLIFVAIFEYKRETYYII